MKKVFAVLFMGIICAALAACAGKTPDTEPETVAAPVVSTEQAEPVPVSQPLPAEEPETQTVWNSEGIARVSLLQETYPVGTQKMTVVVENTGGAELGYGRPFQCERFADGQWEMVEFANNVGFTDDLLIVQPNSAQTMSLHLSLLAEPLKEGVYRVKGDGFWIGQERVGLPGWQLVFRVAPEAQPEPDYALYIPGQPVVGITESLPVKFLNTTGQDANVQDIPHLERRTEDGTWEEVPYKDDRIGFCGTPSSLPAEGRDWSENIVMLWGVLPEGHYRLSYRAGTESLSLDSLACGEFEVCDAELAICGYPLAEDFQPET